MTPTPTESVPVPVPRPRRRAAARPFAAGGLAFLGAMLIQGYSLARKTAGSEEALEEASAEAAMEATSAIGFMNSLVPLTLWGTMYLIAIGLVLSRAPRSPLTIARTLAPLLALMAIEASSALWAGSALKVAINSVHTAGVVAMALVAALHYRDRAPEFAQHLALVLGFNVVVNFVAVVIAPFWAISWEHRWIGLTDTANTLGLLAFTALWSNLAALLLNRGGLRPLHAVLAVLSAIVLFGSDSKTSILSSLVAVSSMGTLWWLFRTVGRETGWTLIQALVGTAALALAALVVGVGEDALLQVATGAMGRSGDFSGRLLHWLIALDLIQTNPINGWGFDSNARVVAETGMPTLHFHNGYLDITVRGGFLALSAMLALVVAALWRFRRCRDVDVVILGVPVLLAMLVYNLTEVTFMQSRNSLWMLFLVTAFMGALGGARRAAAPAPRARTAPATAPGAPVAGAARA